MLVPAAPGAPWTATYWLSKNRFWIAAVGVGVAVEVAQRDLRGDRGKVARLLRGGEVLGDPDVRAAGHAHLAGRVAAGAEVLHQPGAVARLARGEVVVLEVAFAAAGAARVHDRADHAPLGPELRRIAPADAVAAVRRHPEHHREAPRQPGLPVAGRERDRGREPHAVVHPHQHLAGNHLVRRCGQRRSRPSGAGLGTGARLGRCVGRGNYAGRRDRQGGQAGEHHAQQWSGASVHRGRHSSRSAGRVWALVNDRRTRAVNAAAAAREMRRNRLFSLVPSANSGRERGVTGGYMRNPRRRSRGRAAGAGNKAGQFLR